MSRIYLSPPHMGSDERALLLDAFDSNWIAPLGPHVDAFERELVAKLGAAGESLQGLALSSGTAALHLALRVLDIRPGDVVLTSSFTFAATANAITYQNAEPVFIDSEPRTWNIDPALIAQAIDDIHQKGKRVAAVVAVDLYGQCAAYDEIEPLCKRFGIPLIEDAAEALGATYQGRAAGTFGALSAFSFNGNKIITTSGGGMLVGANPQWIAQARHLSTQARDPAPHYQHSTIGYNYRLSNLLAAVGRGQLRHLEARVNARRRIFSLYQEALADIEGIHWMPEYEKGRSTRWLTCATFDPNALGVDRETIRKALEAENIEARPLWKPMHMQPVFERHARYGGAFSEALFRDGLCLPSGSAMTDADVERVASVVRRAVGR